MLHDAYSEAREIPIKYDALLRMYNSDEIDDAERDEIERQLIDMDDDIKEKMDYFEAVRFNESLEVVKWKEAEERMKAKRQRAEAAVARMMRIMDYMMRSLKMKSLTTEHAKFSYRSSKSVLIKDVAALPKSFLRYKDPEPDKVAIKKAIEAGGVVPGAELHESTNLQIR